jgi:hypothetical protein
MVAPRNPKYRSVVKGARMKEVMMHASSTYQKYIRMYDDKSIGNHDALEPVIKYREVEQTAAPAASPLGNDSVAYNHHTHRQNMYTVMSTVG